MTVVKVWLRQDAYVGGSSDGVHILTNEGSVRLQGASIHAWIERLMPFLDGSTDIEELGAGLPSSQARHVNEIIGVLSSRNVVQGWPPETSTRSVGGEWDHEPELSFLSSFIADSRTAYARYRESRALVAGPAPLAEATVHALKASGLFQGRITRHDTQPGRDRGRFDSVTFEVTQPKAAAVHDPSPSERVFTSQLTVLRGEAWIGPVVSGDPHGPTWADAHRRILGLGRPDGLAGEHPQPASPAVRMDSTDPTLNILSNQCVQAVFRRATGAAGRTDGPSVVSVDLDTLASTEHDVLPHPWLRPAAWLSRDQFAESVRVLGEQRPLDETELDVEAARCVDSRLGIIGRLDERLNAQFPLHVTEAEVADPVGMLVPGSATPLVIGCGPDFQAARYRTVLSAFGMYGSMMLDPRRLLHRHRESALVGRTEDPGPALLALRSRSLEARAWAYELGRDRPTTIEVHQAFPALTAVDHLPSSPVGAAAAYDWRGAVSQGLLQHCEELACSELEQQAETMPRLDIDGLTLGEESRRYLRLARALGDSLVAYDFSAEVGVPTIVLVRGERTVACVSGLTIGAAICEGLKRLLMDHQVGPGQPASNRRCDPLPKVPPRRRIEPLQRPVDIAPARPRDLIAALARRGLRSVVVPLDHDPALNRIIPFLVQVVLTRD